MDAVGFIAAVAQLAGAGLKLSAALYDYATTVAGAPKKLGDLASDIKLTASVLEHLRDVFAEAAVRAFVRPGALQTAREAMAGCGDIFAEMERMIEGGKSGVGRWALPFKESKMQLLGARLASLKSTLQLLLQVLQYAASFNM
ncbi:MAG: hypothetical protein INR71_04170 [Terriglobus roseus]|nr:hypothetical protein [Terriglobus roseus]